jgi:hypothetical protein
MRLLATCAFLAIEDPRRWMDIEHEARLLMADAEREIRQIDDLAPVRAQAEILDRVLHDRRARLSRLEEPTHRATGTPS